jgi:hypothetical protein
MGKVSPLEPEELDDGEWLTQRIARGRDAPPEIDRPRPQDRDGVSASRGRKTPAEMYHVVRKGGHCGPDDGVRHARVGALRDAGFKVRHSPNQRNPDHVTISYPGDWDDYVALLFKQCFAVRRWNQSTEGVSGDERSD